jgi:hypothetical protein
MAIRSTRKALGMGAGRGGSRSGCGITEGGLPRLLLYVVAGETLARACKQGVGAIGGVREAAEAGVRKRGHVHVYLGMGIPSRGQKREHTRRWLWAGETTARKKMVHLSQEPERGVAKAAA